MKDLSTYNLNTLSPEEALQTEGGFLPLVVVGLCLLAASCTNTATNTGGRDNTATATQITGQNISSDSATATTTATPTVTLKQ